MPGFLNPDGSELVGALNPSNVGKALRVDAQGNLYVILGPNNVDAQGNLVTSSFTQNAAINANAYVASDGLINAAAAGSFPMAIFNPSTSGKRVLLYSIKVGSANTGYDARLKTIAANPNYNTGAVINNKFIGGVGSAIAGSVTYNNTAMTVDTSPYLRWEPYTKSPTEVLDMGPIFLPANNVGITVWVTVYASGYLSCNMEWIEF